MTSAFHPQSDGQSEVTNKIIAMYLRCLTGDRPRQWLEWLPWAEFCYNSSYQQSIKTSPFELVVYGRPPPSIRSYVPGDARLPAVEKAMKDRDEFLSEVRDRLEQSSTRLLMIAITGSCSFLQASGCGSGFFIGRWRRCR